jgi:hypothetical protein
MGVSDRRLDVVVKYTKAGNPYLALPYSAAEMDKTRRGLNDTPTVVGDYRRPQGQPQRQLQEEPHPREREQP